MPIAADLRSSKPLSTTKSVPARPRLEYEVRHSPTLRAALLRLWRMPGLNHLFRKSVTYMPASLRERIDVERAAVRAAELQDEIANRPRLISERRLRPLLASGLRTLVERGGRESLGDYLEFGVYNGSSLIAMYRELVAAGLDHVRLFGFDSFQGFPAGAADQDGGRWQPGRCHAPLEFTKAVLESEGIGHTRVTLVPGWFSETLTPDTARRFGITRASVIMIDCDLYSSTKEALEFCAPLIGEEALILFDEWKVTGFEDQLMGERKAFCEFLDGHPELRAVPFGKYVERSQAFLIARVS